MEPDLVLTVDVGTTAVKTALWDSSITAVATHAQEYSLRAVHGRIEVPPQRYRALVAGGCAAVLAGTDRRRVRAICLTTQGETLIALDEADDPITDAIVWLDARATTEAAALARTLGGEAFYRTTGVPELGGALPLAKAMQLVNTRPRPHRLLLLEDYLLGWLTGRRVGNRSLHTSTGWFSLPADDYWDDALEAALIDRALLPELVESGQVVGEVLPAPASELGLAPGTPVVSGAMDQAAAAIGAGIDAPGVVAASFGTALVVTARFDEPLLDLALRPTTYRHAVAGAYLGILFTPTAGALLRWLRTLLAQGYDYDDLDRLAADVPPGSDGLLALPFFEGGPEPDAPATGALIGLGLGTGPGQLARSLMEGTSYALRDLLGTLARLGVTVTGLRTHGGGSRSALWQSIAAEVCGIPLTPLPGREAASAGAALLAAWGSGLLPAGTDPRRWDGALTYRPTMPGAYEPHVARYRATLDTLRPLWPDRTAS